MTVKFFPAMGSGLVRDMLAWMDAVEMEEFCSDFGTPQAVCECILARETLCSYLG